VSLLCIACKAYSHFHVVDCHSCGKNFPDMWPSLGLRRRSAAFRLLRVWVRIPLGSGMSVCCECCVLSGRGLCDEPITRPEESYRLWCVVVCDLETSWMRRPWPTGGLLRGGGGKIYSCMEYVQHYFQRVYFLTRKRMTFRLGNR